MALIQAAIIMLIGPLLGVQYGVERVVLMLLVLLLLAAVITSLGILIAARQKTMEGFQVIMQFILMPMLFLSGAFFPVTGGTGTGSMVLRAVAQINPMTYGVEALREIMLAGELPSSLFLHSAGVDVLILIGFFVVFLVPAVLLFSKQD